MSDFVFGAIGLAIFLVVVFVGGYLLYKFKNARLTNAWGPLVAMVDGKVVGDGGGAATSWLTGTYKGRPIQASMVPGRNQYSSIGDNTSNAKYNYFDVALAAIPGKHDWNIQYDRSYLGVGKTGWRISSRDAALEAALNAAGLLPLIESFGTPPGFYSLPTVQYSAREQLLRYGGDNGRQWTPTPEQFVAQLEMLRQLAAINERLNPI